MTEGTKAKGSEDDDRGVDEGVVQESERGRRRTRKRGTLDSRAYLKIYLNNNVYDTCQIIQNRDARRPVELTHT